MYQEILKMLAEIAEDLEIELSESLDLPELDFSGEFFTISGEFFTISDDV